jgi:hypothetical protein
MSKHLVDPTDHNRLELVAVIASSHQIDCTIKKTDHASNESALAKLCSPHAGREKNKWVNEKLQRHSTRNSRFSKRVSQIRHLLFENIATTLVYISMKKLMQEETLMLQSEVERQHIKTKYERVI